MPNIYDNIENRLLPSLAESIDLSYRADFCVGYLNLRGWRSIDKHIEKWEGGDGNCCRVLVGMQRPPQEELRLVQSLTPSAFQIDNQTALRMKAGLAQEFREQLTIGAPSNEDEIGLRNLSKQIKSKKVIVKLFLRHSLHAKLYLLFRPDPINPTVAYIGSSNLTQSGLSRQGELNVDVLDHDACSKLAKWFEDRWNDRWCIDISEELAEIIDESWARKDLIQPHHIYVKIAYHLAEDARTGLTEFQIPKEFEDKLLDFQTAAVKVAAHHLNRRGGVLIGDVVGLGKTLMATALARVFEDDHGLETLILCPKNLVAMWQDYSEEYRLRARVLSIGRVINELPNMRRYRLLVIDESQNLRNREGKRYRAIQEYIRKNDSKCILLSATPYNKTYLDLSSQLRLFVAEDDDLGIGPERLLRSIGEPEFIRKHQAPLRSLAAFEQSEYADDWRELMRLYMVRRTRSFIQENYAEKDPDTERSYLTFNDGSRSYFPKRIPKTINFEIDEQYASFFDQGVVDDINSLDLPRYGLGNYVSSVTSDTASLLEIKVLEDLSRAGKRLMGFCRTNLLKRLESSGHAFLLSVERHVLRNFIFLHAINHELPLPIGTTDVGMLDSGSFDEDAEQIVDDVFDTSDDDDPPHPPSNSQLRRRSDFEKRAKEIYETYVNQYKARFRWLNPDHFSEELFQDLTKDSETLLAMIERLGRWDPHKDAKLRALKDLLLRRHENRKVLIFSQFADTVHYLGRELSIQGVSDTGSVTGAHPDPTDVARRFSPQSQMKKIDTDITGELRILIATDVLSEGQNLQDCAIVVNYDLPWAIIRLIQRAGRVDRIGQTERDILCYSFLPADGIEKLIELRKRVRNRLLQNAEVVGTDEAFFEDEDRSAVLDLYNEKTGILDGEDDADVDLSSYAYQIWKNATSTNPSLRTEIEAMPSVVYSTKRHSPTNEKPSGVLVYMHTTQGLDSLAWMDEEGNSVTDSQFEILRAAQCEPKDRAMGRHERHHELVRSAIKHVTDTQVSVGGQLGRPSGARFRTYERLKSYIENLKDSLFDSTSLRAAIDEIYRFPLRKTARDTLNRQLKSSITDDALVDLVLTLRDEDRLCVVHEEDSNTEPQIICSLGLSR